MRIGRLQRCCGLAIYACSLLPGVSFAQQANGASVRPQTAVPVKAAASMQDRAEDRPFQVYQTIPVILHGPFVLDPSETSATIEWVTDAPCVASVRYGEAALNQEATPEEDALRPVGTLHRVELTGLLPGHTYRYQVVSTRVVRVKAYWPDMGLPSVSPSYSFTTLDASKPFISFSLVTDTHEDTARIDTLMKMIDWKTTDFLVHTGDGLNWVQDSDQLFERWLDPLSMALVHSKPLIYARGNHELRGPFARSLNQYLTTPGDNRFYFSRDDGPVHLIVIDTAEDKSDAASVYAGLNLQTPYRHRELVWFKQHVQSDPRMDTAPFRVVVMHQPDWGWLDGNNREWTDVANQGQIDLVIAGHEHRFFHLQPGQAGNNYPILVVGQDQVARVEATQDNLHVTVAGKDGKVIDAFDLKRRSK